MHVWEKSNRRRCHIHHGKNAQKAKKICRKRKKTCVLIKVVETRKLWKKAGEKATESRKIETFSQKSGNGYPIAAPLMSLI